MPELELSMEHLKEDLMKVLGPVLKSQRKAHDLLDHYWQDKIALVWTTRDVHRAANEKNTVLTEPEAREVLSDLLLHYNPQYGLRWSDVTDSIENSGKGRDLTRQELDRFIHQNRVSIQRRQRK